MIVLLAVLVLDALLMVAVAPLAASPLLRVGLIGCAVVMGCLSLAVLLEVLREWK